MSHADILEAIERSGGRLVASFVLDENGRTLGPRGGRARGRSGGCNTRRRCSGCREYGHDLKRCNGPGNPPRPTHDERRRQR